MNRERFSAVAKGTVGFAVAFAAAEVVIRTGAILNGKLQPLSEVVAEATRLAGDSEFLSQVGTTMQVWAIGLALSILVGVLAGTALGLSLRGYVAFRGLIELLRPIPSVALVPLAILVFGLTMKMELSLVLYATFWPILIATSYGVRRVDPTLIDSARAFGVTRPTTVGRVILPAAAPMIVTGIRVAASIAFLITITAEIAAGTSGLGHVIANAQAIGNTDVMYAGILVAGLIGTIVNIGLRVVGDRALFWHTGRYPRPRRRGIRAVPKTPAPAPAGLR